MYLLYLMVGLHLTMPPINWYTIGIMTNKGDIMKTLKQLGLLDTDFLTGMIPFVLALVIGVTS